MSPAGPLTLGTVLASASSDCFKISYSSAPTHVTLNSLCARPEDRSLVRRELTNILKSPGQIGQGYQIVAHADCNGIVAWEETGRY